MTDSPTEPTGPNDSVYPWDEPAEPAETSATAAPRERHDAFNEARKRAFLTALVKCGCLLDACRAAGVVARTVYRHEESDPAFAEHVRLALAMAATPLELTAFQRAVEGVEQAFACGGEVHVRRRYDSGLLRLLLQGANPKKYGRNPGFTRKRLLKHERKAIERELRAELEMRYPPRALDEVHASILTKLEAIDAQRRKQQLAAGWTKTPGGDWVPPGYAPIPGWTPPAAPPGDEAAPAGAFPGDLAAPDSGPAHPSDPPLIV